MNYFTDWKEAVIESERKCGIAHVYTEHICKGHIFNIGKIKRERNCHTIHVVFIDRPSRFELLDLREC